MTLAETDERSSRLDTTIVRDHQDMRLEGRFRPSLLERQDVDATTLRFGSEVIATLPHGSQAGVEGDHPRKLTG